MSFQLTFEDSIVALTKIKVFILKLKSNGDNPKIGNFHHPPKNYFSP